MLDKTIAPRYNYPGERMRVVDFERMIGRAGYSLNRVYHGDDETRRVYFSSKGAPRLNVPEIGGEISDYDALKIEAMLDEEGFFQGEAS